MTATIALRLATRADKKNLFFWRNHEAVRRYALDPSIIPWETHGIWLDKTLADATKILLIAESLESNQEPVGVLRYDVEAFQARVSVFLVPEKIGQGYGASVLQAGLEWMQDQHPDIRQLLAEILPENYPSIRVFEKAGYRQNQLLSNREVLRYEYTFR